jgi:hypothetical protein
MNLRSIVRAIFSPWVMAGAVALAIVLMCATLSLVWVTRPDEAASGPPTAILSVIQAPTSTPVVDTPTPPAGQQSTEAVPPAPLPGTFGIGAYVQISGTEGDGLRLRSAPGLQGQVEFLALESEVFQIREGPRDADGYTWWFVVAPYDENVQGWAVSNYLAVVQNP